MPLAAGWGPFVVLLASSCTTSVEDRSDETAAETSQELSFADARQLIAAGRFDEAVTRLRLDRKGGLPASVIPVATRVLQERGWDRLASGDAAAAVADYDRIVKLAPNLEPSLWQRGIAHYYAGKFQEGATQFEVHRLVNPADVENPVWHLLCLARTPGQTLESARRKMLPVGPDPRVPMAEIRDLFAGSGSVEAVDAAATRAGSDSARLYADLYIGLYHEASGDPEKGLTFIRRAAESPLRGSGMGQIAAAHVRIRKAEAAASATDNPEPASDADRP